MSTIIDNGGTGYSETGAGWTTSTGEGYGGSIRYHASGVSSANHADFNFTGLTTSVMLRVGLTWTANANRETATPWTLFDSDGTTVLASGSVNQNPAPADFADGGVNWAALAYKAPTGTSLTLRIGANGPNAAKFVVADAAQVDTVPALTAGSVSWANTATSASAVVSTTITATGVPPYTYDIEVAPDVSGSEGSYTAQGLASSSPLMTVTGLTAGNYYWLRQKITDTAAATAHSSGVRIKAAVASSTVEFPLDASSIISIDNGFDSGSRPPNVYDGSFTTYYTSATNTNPWVGIDLGSGNAAALTDLWFVPRTDGGHDSTLYNAAVECAATSGGTWTSYGSTSGYPFIEAWNHFTFSGTTNRSYRIRAANSPEGFLQVAEVRFGGTFVAGLRWRPARPTLSPASGRYSAGSTVSLTTSTGGASLYYTTDGTTPAVSVVSGVLTPSGTTTLYTGPISLASSSSVQVIQAIAVHEGSTNSTSHVVPGYFRAPAKFVPDTGAAPTFSTSHIPEDWYDDRGILIEGHGGHVLYDPVSAKYYWYGFQTANPAGEPGRGVVCYSSTDLYNWHYEGPAADNATGLDATMVDITRMHVGYNSAGTSDAKYVMVANLYASGYGTGFTGFAKAASPAGPFTWVAKALPGGFYPGDVGLFIDPNDGKWYTVDNVNHATNLILCEMDSATGYLSYTGTTITVDSTGGKEDPALIYRNGRYWLFSGAINYGGIGGLAANSVYKSATTLAGLNAVGWTTIWPSAPGSTDVANSAQLTCIFPVQGRTDSWIFMFDWWDIGEGSGTIATLNLHHARSAWFPAVAANWPTSTTFQMATPGALSWDLSSLPGGADTTAPVVASASVDTAGTTLTITFTESGSPPVLPATGATGFTLNASGGAATLSSPSITSTTYTATISRTILAVETLTLDYSPGNVTDSAATPNDLAAFAGTAVTNNSTQTGPLTAGTASFVSSGPAGISVTATDASAGTSPYTYQWQRSTDGGSYADIGGATTRSITDATGATGHLYGYQLVYTDTATTTVTSNAVTAQVYTGGAIGSGTGVSGARIFTGF